MASDPETQPGHHDVRGIPGATAVHHVAYTVPDLHQAVQFFTEVIGAELVYLLGPVQNAEGDWMTRHLGVAADACAHIAMLRLGAVTNLELFEYTAPDQRRILPRNSDWGGHHLAIHVTDVDAAVAYLRAQPGVRVLGEPETISDGPIAGDRWVYFLTPWGMQMELIHLPPGLPYERQTQARLYQPGEPWSNTGRADGRPPRITHVPAGQGPTTWFDGDVYTVKASGETTNGTLAFLEASIPPGSGPPPHVHTREDEAFYILSGQLEIGGGGQRFLAGPEDFVFIPRGAGHCFKNVSAHSVRMAFLYTPAGFDRFFAEAGEPAEAGRPIPTWGPAEFRRATEIAPRYGWRQAPADDADD